MKIIVVSGGFDPVHSGHIAYFKAASELGDKLVVALNSDEWLVDKKGSLLMPFNERKTVIENMAMVDEVISFQDDDKKSASNALIKIRDTYPSDSIIFANGGDRNESNIPEMSVEGIDFVFNVGGDDKINSSSLILKKWRNSSEERLWGEFSNLFVEKHVKVKELIVAPGKATSFQKHFMRNELWFISKGSCEVNYSDKESGIKKNSKLNTFDYYFIPVGKWHQIVNISNHPCHIIEIQYGKSCDESDIVRSKL